MVQAIASASVASGFGTGSSSGVLEAQLNRYQIQLADWCNCPSGKTPEGKAKIQQIQDKIDAVNAQLERIAGAKSRQASASDQMNGGPISSANAGTGSPQGAASASSPAVASLTTIGSVLDTFV